MLTKLNLILDPIAMSQNLKTGHSDIGEGGNWFLSESASLGIPLRKVRALLSKCMILKHCYNSLQIKFMKFMPSFALFTSQVLDFKAKFMKFMKFMTKNRTSG